MGNLSRTLKKAAPKLTGDPKPMLPSTPQGPVRGPSLRTKDVNGNKVEGETYTAPGHGVMRQTFTTTIDKNLEKAAEAIRGGKVKPVPESYKSRLNDTLKKMTPARPAKPKKEVPLIMPGMSAEELKKNHEKAERDRLRKKLKLK